MLRALFATLALAALVAALPAAAIAQDAGSNQYQDPLAGEPGSNGGNNGNSGSSGNSGNGANTTPSSGGHTQNVQPESGSGAGTQSAQSGEQLPATGLDAWLIAFTGVGLLALGVGLRLRVGARPTA